MHIPCAHFCCCFFSNLLHMSQQRKLAAIMFTDIVGYTAMMQEDETRAMAMRTRHREVFEKYHEEFNGDILQYYGDGTLSIFDSAIDGTKCALAIQEELQQEPKVPLRIGLHTGDIIYSKEEAIGDGVNIASRIESLAVPGSIMLSETVFNYIKNQSEFEAQSMGQFSFKNVAKPIEVYALHAGNIVIPSPQNLRGKFTDHKLPNQKNLYERMPIWAKYVAGFALFLVLAPFIYFPLYQSFTGNAATKDNPLVNQEDVKKFYVAPFVQVGGDSSNNWMGLGIPYALEMDWDQDPYIFNLYPEEAKDKPLNSQLEEAVFTHSPKLLKGTYQVTDAGYEIQVLIYEVKSGQLQYDSTFSGKDFFPLLDEISLNTKRILEIPEEHLQKVKDLPISQMLTKSLPAYKLFSSALTDRSTGTNFFPFEKLEKVIETDSTFAWAAYTISKYHHQFQRSELTAKSQIKRAMRHRNRLPDIFEAEIRMLQYRIDGEPEKALELSKMLAKLNPAKPTFLMGLASDYFNNDQYDKTIETLQTLKENQALDSDPYTFISLELKAFIRNKELPKALKLAQQYVKDNPENNGAKTQLGLVYLAAQDWEKAKTIFEQQAILNPEYKNFERYLTHIQFMTDSTLNTQLFDQLVGEYWIENFSNFQFNIERVEDDLYVKIKNQQKSKLYPMSSLSYFTEHSFSMKFVLDSLGKVSKFHAAEGSRGSYPVLKISPDLLSGIDAFRAGDFEKAAPILEKLQSQDSDYNFVQHLVKHIAYSKEEQYVKQRESYKELAGTYQYGQYSLDIDVKEGILYMMSNSRNTIFDPIQLYEIEPNTFVNLIDLNKTFVFSRENGRVTGLTSFRKGEKRNTAKKF